MDHKEYLARYGRLPVIAGAAGAAIASAPGSQEGLESVPGIAGAVIPFTQASKPVYEEGPSWSGIKQNTEDQVQEPLGIPANGYARGLFIKIETTSEGTLGEGVVIADYPWCILRTIKFEDQGGHEIYGPLGGFSSYLATKWGAYFRRPDFKNLPSFVGTGEKPNATFYVPVEICRTGLGALTNQTEATRYHLALTVSSLSGSYSHVPTTAPTFRIRTWMWTWPLPQASTEPEPGAPQGRRQQQRPPLLGTIQYWTEQPSIKIQAGQNRIVYNRVGQMIRTHILVTRNTSGVRVGSVIGNPIQLDWARVRFRTIDKDVLRDIGFATVDGTLEDEGVYPFIYSEGEQNYAGANEVNSWLATVNTTSLALNMSNWSEGLLTIITNDVAVGAVQELARRETPGQTAEREPRMVS